MKRPSMPRRWVVAGALSCLATAAFFLGARAYLHSPNRGLPYHDSFARGVTDEWTAFGGTWELINGTMRNDSDERGAKLLAGSHFWHDYSIDADVYLLGVNGDAGLIIRSSNEEEGVNAYSGYYAGVRTLDNSLVLGRADHGWMEVTRQVPAPGVIRPFHWYHLKLLAAGCRIAAELTAPPSVAHTSLDINDPGCVSAGRIGLRSYSSGGMWRNVVVRPATHEDLLAMLQTPGTSSDGAHPASASGVNATPASAASDRLSDDEKPITPSVAAAQSIASLRLGSFAESSRKTIRGVVILTTPRLYVEDSTGGIYILHAKGPFLKVGDEIEATGEVQPGNFSSTMDHGTVQVLWARTPVPPVSVTASQASTGKYDAMFIEVSGRLVGKEQGPANTRILDLSDGSQSFRAIMNPGRSEYLFKRIKLGSTLRLRGVCVADTTLTQTLTPFVLLLRSNEDLQIIAGPPWWSTGHVIAIIIAALLLALIAVILYHRVEHWRLRAVFDERSRLAHEMHDTLAQSFAGIGFQLQAIRNQLPEGMATLHQQIELASELVSHSHEEARRSIATLRSETLESEDLLPALERCARSMVGPGPVQVASRLEGDQRTISLRITDTLFRIGQEAIANAIRHADPAVITIRVAYRGDAVSLLVEDNGKGFVPGSNPLGFGIRGMRRRAQSISAAFHLKSAPGEGTQIRVDVPLPPQATFTTWPKLYWKYLVEHWINGRPGTPANSHPYRG
jgi:signal transduction histidine kinase